MTDETLPPLPSSSVTHPITLSRRVFGTVLLVLLFTFLSLAQILLAYRKELEPFLNKSLKAYRGWIEILPDYCIPVIPTSLAVLLAVMGTLILVIWRRTSFEQTIQENAPLQVACPHQPWIHKRVTWLLSPVFLVLSVSGWLWAMMLTARRGPVRVVVPEHHRRWISIRNRMDLADLDSSGCRSFLFA